jgi:DNA-binding response OmpR family regulator
MPHRLRAVAFDLDAASLVSLRDALPEWEIDLASKSTTTPLTLDWSPEAANLVVIAVGDGVAETLGLCRGLRSPAGRAHTPLLVLVPPAQDALVKAMLEAGADSCLVLPIHAKQVARMLARVRQGNQPGRHTLDLDQAQAEDRWRDEGGQG